MFSLHTKLWRRPFRLFSKPAMFLLTVLITIFGIGAIIRAIVFAETSAVGSLVVVGLSMM